MGRHSAKGRLPVGSGRGPEEITSLGPASSYTETPQQADKRLRDTYARPGDPQRRTKIIIRIVAAVALVLLFAGVGVAVGGYLYMKNIDSRMTKKLDKLDVNGEIKKSLAAPRKPGEPFYILLMGIDTRPSDNAPARSDSLILARIDPQQKRIAMISIPRDSRVDIPGHKTFKINSAMQLGGPSLAIQTVTQLTGVPISHFMAVDFNGFKDLVDAIGGVYVTVPEAINDRAAANWDRKAAHVPAGYQKLDGKHALTFVRARHQYADQDYSRMKNQQSFIKALGKQTLQIQNAFKINLIIEAALKNMTTDMNVQDILNLAADFSGMKPNGIETATMPSDPKYIGGVSYVIVNREKMDAMIKRFESGKPLDSEKAKAAQDATLNAAAGGLDPATVTLAVRNGVGKKGVANDAAAAMKGYGFQVKEIGNTAKPVYGQTLVIYKGSDPSKAATVKAKLGFGQLVAARGMYSFTTDVLLVVGRDWVTPAPASASSTVGSTAVPAQQ
jgi:LCP family protein required for cell wall assembly